MTKYSALAGLAIVVATASLSTATARSPAEAPSPSDAATTRYCLRLEAPTGSLIEPVKCWTRAQWVEQGVDIDKEWPREGVAIRR